MSLIELYFLHSTSVLSFYIDVVLTLSIVTDQGFVYCNENTPCTVLLLSLYYKFFQGDIVVRAIYVTLVDSTYQRHLGPHMQYMFFKLQICVLGSRDALLW